MKRDHQHKLLSRAKAVVTAYNKKLREKKHHFGDGFNDMARVIHNLEAMINTVEGNPRVPKRQEYKVIAMRGRGHSPDDSIEVHESYGMLGFARMHGGHGASRLFGSHITYHANTIRLTISHAERRFGLSSERFGTTGLPLVEVELSAHQFAEAITTLNMGEGIPCTIRSVDAVQMEDLPNEHIPENRVIQANFTERVADIQAEMDESLRSLDAILDKKSINKGDRADIRRIVHEHIRFLDDSAPFVVSQFGRSVAKVVSTAKAEVEAFVTSSIVNAGLASLAEARKLGQRASKALGSGDEGES